MAYFNCFYAKRASAFPDGKTVTPTNDIQTLLHCAGITDKAYTTLSVLLADSTTLNAVITSNNAVDYLVRSTTWASDMCADSTAMSYIGLNNYASNTLLADSTWASAICNSTYFESVLNVKVPTMTSNNTPSGCVFGGGSVMSLSPTAYKAFNNEYETVLTCSGQQTVQDVYVGYEFENDVNVFDVLISRIGYSLANMQGTWVVECQVNGSNTWNVISNSLTFTHGVVNNTHFTITDHSAIRKIRVRQTNSATANTEISMCIVGIYGRADV